MAYIGIDLWHAVEFSRYGCALGHGISSIFQGRPPNLLHARERGQTGQCAQVEMKIAAVRPNSSDSQQEQNYSPRASMGQIEISAGAVLLEQ